MTRSPDTLDAAATYSIGQEVSFDARLIDFHGDRVTGRITAVRPDPIMRVVRYEVELPGGSNWTLNHNEVRPEPSAAAHP